MISQREQRALEDYFARELTRGEACRIVALERLAVGQSRAMYRVDLEGAFESAATRSRRTLVLRVEQWGLLGTDSTDEVRAMRALHTAGYPVAKILAYEPTTEVLSQPFFAMEFIDGSTAATPESLEEYVRSLARLHALDPAAGGLDFLEQPAGPRDAARLQVERWYGIYRSSLLGEPSPLVEEAAEWLRIHAPSTAHPCLVHGDPGPGNYMHRGGRLLAVVDWEFIHLGDADEDWAYLIAMRGATLKDEPTWLAYLERTVGLKIDADRLHYWKALNFFKSVCIDQTALKIYMDGRNPAPNMLAIGTAIHLGTLRQLCEVIG